MSKTIGKLSENEKLDVAIVVCEALGINADIDDNLWQMVEYIDFDNIRNASFKE